jgi:hypothetical protein
MEDFSITTRLTEKEYSRVLYILLYRKPGIVYTSIFGLLIVLGRLKIIPFYSDTTFLETLVGLFLLLLPTITVLRSSKEVRSTSGIQDEITYTFNESGLIIQGSSFKTEFQWAYIRNLLEINKFLILSHRKAAGYYIDKTKLTNEQLGFIRSKVKVG